ncbi:hypothetical protein EPUS_02363 [Endocarpon pusillum Z07020]|uniref:TEA domain-containing protein n=1 Tax=Endocarpon pusillum (strain Z07020 / HMAS-L-300199) TaxID=1263415 RepID=U1GGD4_ENDPU|nr:uncharacterized protein EPUS_02363 [Endocarpon pusillum Z07020]ERF70841.1 hypothetical protein EPUS_02363 [Endocarpon pusillum Z07020]
MEHWPTELSIPSSHSEEQRSIRGAGPLKTVSGNRQTFALDCHAGSENQNPHDLYYINSALAEANCASNTFPTTATLGSNDNDLAIHRLQHRHQRRQQQRASAIDFRIQDRSYLNSKKYQGYRARQRKDLGHDNKQVWSDDVEEAFQEALFEIKPMGKGKRSQHGRPHGRNELVAEYIFRRTGQRRTRKQVSSHIQVLNALLKDIPSWRVLIQAIDRADGRPVNGGFYENSIEHSVERRNKRLAAQHSSYREHGYSVHTDNLPSAPQTLGSNACTISGKRVTGVNFEMWMSPNQSNMDKRLHDFTSLQTARDLPRCDPSPLEDVRDWRALYPCLAATLDGKGDVPEFDIIGIETSYKMMSDFPPPKATLGLRLELDFGPSSREELYDWTCTTHIYRNGIPVKQASHYRLEAKYGMIAPPFDSMWWALTFIDRMEQKKQAEESGKRDVYDAAQQRAQKFFSELTAVHEIRARSQADSSSQDQRPERRLVAALLWRFSMAPESFVGTTSWQRLLPPPARITTNSPAPDQREMSLPPLAIDTIVGGLHHSTDLSATKDLLVGQPHDSFQDYEAVLDDPTAMLGHHDFEMAFKDDDIAHFASMQSSFISSTQNAHDGSSYPTIDHLDYDIQLHGLSTPSHHDTFQPACSNIFEAQHINRNDYLEDHQKQSQGHMYELHQDFEHHIVDADDRTQRRPLANFDQNTHNMLQAQLREPRTDHSKPEDAGDETLKAALAAASAMSDLGTSHAGLPLPPPHPSSQAEAKQEHMSALWEGDAKSSSSSASSVHHHHRPQLHMHASFTSQASYTPHHDHEHEHEQPASPDAASAVHLRAFDAENQLPASPSAGLDAHRYHNNNPATASPEIRRLLEMHNQSFD